MFLIWGLYHGLFLVLERLFLGRLLKKVKGLNILFTFLVVSLGWVAFRAETIEETLLFFDKLFLLDDLAIDVDSRLKFTFGLVVLFHLLGAKFGNVLEGFLIKTSPRTFWIKTIVTILLFVICLGELYASGFNPFIYFRF